MIWWSKAREIITLWRKAYQLAYRREGFLYAVFEATRLTWAMLRPK